MFSCVRSFNSAAAPSFTSSLYPDTIAQPNVSGDEIILFSGKAEKRTLSCHSSGIWSIIQYPLGIIAASPAKKFS